MTQLEQARREETAASHNFALLKQSLEDQMSVDTQDMGAAKAGKQDAAGTKAQAGSDLAVAQADLADAEKVLNNMDSDCQTKAADHETTVANRAEELKALAAAKQA